MTKKRLKDKDYFIGEKEYKNAWYSKHPYFLTIINFNFNSPQNYYNISVNSTFNCLKDGYCETFLNVALIDKKSTILIALQSIVKKLI